MSLGEYAEKHTKKSSQCKDKVRMKLAHALHDACRAVGKIVSNGTILTTSHVEAMKGKLKKVTNDKGEKIKFNPIFHGQNSLPFPSVNCYSNAMTEVPHTEKDTTQALLSALKQP